MSKPEDIPEWAWEKASNRFNAAWDAHDEQFNSASNSISPGLAGRFIEASARAILAAVEEEREACAVVADDLREERLEFGAEEIIRANPHDREAMTLAEQAVFAAVIANAIRTRRTGEHAWYPSDERQDREELGGCRYHPRRKR